MISRKAKLLSIHLKMHITKREITWGWHTVVCEWSFTWKSKWTPPSLPSTPLSLSPPARYPPKSQGKSFLSLAKRLNALFMPICPASSFATNKEMRKYSSVPFLLRVLRLTSFSTCITPFPLSLCVTYTSSFPLNRLLLINVYKSSALLPSSAVSFLLHQ